MILEREAFEKEKAEFAARKKELEVAATAGAPGAAVPQGADVDI